VTGSLRDRVEAALLAELEDTFPGFDDLASLADVLTGRAFDAMSDARPCVTCGKGIGPAKVAKGYVQCYDCTRRRPTRGMMATEHPLST
jgi:hypothetical protein